MRQDEYSAGGGAPSTEAGIRDALEDLRTLLNDAEAQQWLCTPGGQALLTEARFALDDADPVTRTALDDWANEQADAAEHRHGVTYDLTDWEAA